MRRRTLLQAIAAGGVVGGPSLSGCTDSDEGLGWHANGTANGDTPTPPSPTEDGSSPTQGDATSPTPDESDAHATAMLVATLRGHECTDIDVQFDDDTVVVLGCVRGSNGCHEPHLRGTVLKGKTLFVTVASVDTSGSMEACTDVLVENGYEVVARFDDGLPSRVEVIHDDMDGRRTVATVEG